MSGRGQPLLSLTLSFGEIPWFHVQGEMQRCDWSKTHFLVCARYEYAGYGSF